MTLTQAMSKKKETLEELYKSKCNNNKQVIEAKKARMDDDKMIEDMERKIIKQIRTGQQQNLMGIGSHKQISKCLKGGAVQPLTVLEIPNSNGILTTDENKMDKIARDAWTQMFDGHIQNEEK